MYAGRQQAILNRRERIKRENLERRKRENLGRAAGPSEIVVSNIAYQRLGEASQADFDELPTIEAHNMGMIKAWKYAPREKPQGSC